jgi:hypothetical protein
MEQNENRICDFKFANTKAGTRGPGLYTAKKPKLTRGEETQVPPLLAQ